MAVSRKQPQSRSKTVTLRGGRKVKSKMNTGPSYKNKRNAPRYLVAPRTISSGIAVGRGRSSWAPKVDAGRSIPKYSLANADAFHAFAEGCKVPDMSSMPSATSWSRDVTTISSNNNGIAYTAFRAQPSMTVVDGTYSSYTQPYWVPGYGKGPIGKADPAFANMVANYLDVRTVAVGLKIQCIQPALTCCGFIHVAVVPDDFSGTTWSYPMAASGQTAFAAMERAPYYQKFPIANLINNTLQVQIPIMDSGAYRYRNVNQTPQQISGSSVLSTSTAETTVPASSGTNYTVAAQNVSTGLITLTGTVTSNSATSGGVLVNFTSSGAAVFASAPTVTCQRYMGASLTTEMSGDPYLVTPYVGVVSTSGFTFMDTYWDAKTDTGGYGSTDVFTWTAVGVPASTYAPVTTAAFAGAGSIETTFGWGAVIVALEGAVASTAVLEVESMTHYEAIPGDTAGTVITTTAASPFSNVIQGATKFMQDAMGPFRNQADGSSPSSMMSGIAGALYDGATAVAGCASPGLALGMSAFKPYVIKDNPRGVKRIRL